MKTLRQTNPPQIRPPHLTYSAFCLTPRDPTTGFSRLTAVAKNPNFLCPVKQKRALLESTPPRDNWTEGDEIKPSPLFGEAASLPKKKSGDLYFRAESCLIKLFQHIILLCWKTQIQTARKDSLSRYPFFRSKRKHFFSKPPPRIPGTRVNPSNSDQIRPT